MDPFDLPPLHPEDPVYPRRQNHRSLRDPYTERMLNAMDYESPPYDRQPPRSLSPSDRFLNREDPAQRYRERRREQDWRADGPLPRGSRYNLRPTRLPPMDEEDGMMRWDEFGRPMGERSVRIVPGFGERFGRPRTLGYGPDDPMESRELFSPARTPPHFGRRPANFRDLRRTSESSLGPDADALSVGLHRATSVSSIGPGDMPPNLFFNPYGREDWGDPQEDPDRLRFGSIIHDEQREDDLDQRRAYYYGTPWERGDGFWGGERGRRRPDW